MLLLVELGEPLHQNNKLEFVPHHLLKLPLQFISVTAKLLYNLRVVDTEK